MDGGTIDDELRKASVEKYTASIRALMAIRDTKSLGEAVAVLGALRTVSYTHLTLPTIYSV